MNSFLERVLAPTQTQSSAKNFARDVSFCCSNRAVSASILRSSFSSAVWPWTEEVEKKIPARRKIPTVRMAPPHSSLREHSMLGWEQTLVVSRATEPPGSFLLAIFGTCPVTRPGLGLSKLLYLCADG